MTHSKRTKHSRSISSKRHSKRRRNRNRSKYIKRRRTIRGGGTPSPWQGSPYNASDLNPSGTFLPQSPVGIPSGGFNPPIPSNPQVGGFNSLTQGRGGYRSTSKYKSRRGRKQGGCWTTKKQKRSNGRKGKQSGGKGTDLSFSSFVSTILPDDVVNAYRSVPAAFGHFADKFNGVASSPSSNVYPTQQNLTSYTSGSGQAMTVPNIQSFYNQAVNTVPTI